MKIFILLIMAIFVGCSSISGGKIQKPIRQNDPHLYEPIGNSTVTKYKVKKVDIAQKPCNLRDAHDKLDKIFQENNLSISDNTDMIEFHMGLGMWIRNNWGLWSGKSRLLPLFEIKKMRHPDEMSAFILDTYKERVLLLQRQPDSLNAFYVKTEDIECKN
jgi:hypothetical protein